MYRVAIYKSSRLTRRNKKPTCSLKVWLSNCLFGYVSSSWDGKPESRNTFVTSSVYYRYIKLHQVILHHKRSWRPSPLELETSSNEKECRISVWYSPSDGFCDTSHQVPFYQVRFTSQGSIAFANVETSIGALSLRYDANDL
jgi:hypothetical protein